MKNVDAFYKMLLSITKEERSRCEWHIGIKGQNKYWKLRDHKGRYLACPSINVGDNQNDTLLGFPIKWVAGYYACRLFVISIPTPRLAPL